MTNDTKHFPKSSLAILITVISTLLSVWFSWFVGTLYIFWIWVLGQISVQFSSVSQCTTLCDPMDCSTPGFPVQHQLPELAQTHVHQIGDAMQLSHPLSFPSLPANFFLLVEHVLLRIFSPGFGPGVTTRTQLCFPNSIILKKAGALIYWIPVTCQGLYISEVKSESVSCSVVSHSLGPRGL